MNPFLKLAYNHGVQQALRDLEKQGAFYDDVAALARRSKYKPKPSPAYSASRLPGPRRFIPLPTISEASLAREAQITADLEARANEYIEALKAMGSGSIH